MLARTRKWVESWDRVKDRPEDELKEYILGKCKNVFRSRRNRRATSGMRGHDPGRAGQGKDELSPLAGRVVAYVRKRLEEDGYDVEVNLDETGGVAYAEVHFRTLTKAAR